MNKLQRERLVDAAVGAKVRELLSPTIAAEARRQAFEDVQERAALCPNWLSWRFAEWAAQEIAACAKPAATVRAKQARGGK